MNATGPLTPQGKFNSSKNAFTHGLSAQNIERFPESIREAYRAFYHQQLEELQPQTLNEEVYASQYAFAQFQLLRGQSLLMAAREAAFANPDDEAAEKRLASVEANEALAEIAGPGLEFPIAFPHHMLLEKKAFRRPIADHALRFALSQNSAPLAPPAAAA